MCVRERQRYTGSLPNMPSLWNAQFGQHIIFIPSNTNSFFLANIFKIIAPSLLVFILKTRSTVTSYSHPTALQTEQKTCFSCLTWHPFINLSSAPNPLISLTSGTHNSFMYFFELSSFRFPLISEITWYLTFIAWLTSPNVMTSKMSQRAGFQPFWEAVFLN